MDVRPLLDRLGLTRPVRPDLAALRRIHRAWRTLVPYENLDLQLGREITLEPAALVDKFGTRGRGGTCFQMNGALAVLLEELGFAVSVVEGAVLRAVRGEQVWGNHIAVLVDIGTDRWLADVGIGDSFLDPLPLIEGTHRQGTLDFRMERLDSGTWRAHHHPGGVVASWDFRLAARPLSEFAEPARQSNPVLRRVLVAQHHRHGHELALRSRVFSRTRPGGSRQRILDSQREFTDTLARQFRISPADFGSDDLRLLWEKTATQYHDWLAIRDGRSPSG